MESASYTTKDVARLARLSERLVRAYARASGVKKGGGPLRFEFRDLLLLRTAKTLLEQGVAASRLERTLEKLRAQVNAPLSTLRIEADRGAVVVHDGQSSWEPETGQARFKFSASEESPSVILNATQSEISTQQIEGNFLMADNYEAAQHWFDMAIEAEADQPEQAYQNYLRALACNPEHVEALINIGRLCSLAGDAQRAAAYFRQSLRVDPTHPVAHFNLAVTLHDEGDVDGAISQYQVALIHDPQFADAHFNLAALLEQQGDLQGALKHRHAYKEALHRNE